MSSGDQAGYRALRESAAWLDRSSRGRIRATGDDRVRLLHAMTTNHIEMLQAGESCYAFFLDANGRILADAVILALPDALLLSTEPETRESLCQHLDKYIIVDDVTLEDVTADTAEISIEGPSAPALRDRFELYNAVPFTATGEPGFTVIAPVADRAAILRALDDAGVVPASREAAEIVRLENGKPRYSEDITDRYLPHETQVLSAVHFDKGCYIGQEIVERVRSRGGVHRFLVPLEIDSAHAPQPGAKIKAGEKDTGEITSAVFSPALGRVVALGYLRLGEVPAEAELNADGAAVRVRARKPFGAA